MRYKCPPSYIKWHYGHATLRHTDTTQVTMLEIFTRNLEDKIKCTGENIYV